MNTRTYFTHVWLRELKTTINAFLMLPEDKLDYRPHPKTRSAKQIVEHITAQPDDILEAFASGEIHHRRALKFDSLPDAIAAYEAKGKQVAEAAGKADGRDWDEKIIPFIVGGTRVNEGPLREVCFTFLFDLVHHRGQLSTYYRPMGTRNPFIYGPTAEMIEEMKAARAKDSAS